VSKDTLGAAMTPKAGKAVKNSAINDNLVTTPTITISGSEDLGGGLKARFVIAKEFDAATGVESNDKDFINTYVGLTGGFGSIDAGRITPATRDAGGVYRFFGDIGRLPSAFNSGSGRKNTVQYVSPTFGGVAVSLSRTDAGKSTNGDKADGRQDTIGLRGAVAGVNFSLGRETAKDVSNDKARLTTFGANYDFKVAKVGLVYVKAKADTGYSTTGKNKGDGLGLHVAVPVAPNLTIGGSYSEYDNDETKGSTDVIALAAKYDLSKRTAVYASYQRVEADKKGGAGIASSRGMGVAEITDKNTNGYGISIVHSF